MGPSPISSGRAARVLVCVLAAGASSRMGFPKLLAAYPGPDGTDTCLLARACRAALGSRAAQVAVVTGAYAGEMAPVLEGLREGFEDSRRHAGGADPADPAHDVFRDLDTPKEFGEFTRQQLAGSSAPLFR